MRNIPEIMMDIIKDYAMVDGGKKPLLDYLDEVMAAYGEIEKEYQELTLWQQDINKDIRDMKITMNRFMKDK